MHKNPNYKGNNGLTLWNRFTWVKIKKSAGSSSKFIVIILVLEYFIPYCNIIQLLPALKVNNYDVHRKCRQ